MTMLTRRHLLSVTGSAATMLALGPVRLALADAPTDARFVLAIQRGAMDGLHAVPPYGDPKLQGRCVWNLALSRRWRHRRRAPTSTASSACIPKSPS